jgi:Bacterial PH domain
MKYVQRVLQPGESVVHAARLHWLIFLTPVVLLILAVVCAVLAIGSDKPGIAIPLLLTAGLLAPIGLIAAVSAVIRRMTTELVLTDRRVIYKTGIFQRHTMEMNRSKVETVGVDQSILGRLLNYGTVVVRGTGGSLEPIRQIDDPLSFRSHITAG